MGEYAVTGSTLPIMDEVHRGNAHDACALTTKKTQHTYAMGKPHARCINTTATSTHPLARPFVNMPRSGRPAAKHPLLGHDTTIQDDVLQAEITRKSPTDFVHECLPEALRLEPPRAWRLPREIELHLYCFGSVLQFP